MVQQRMMQQLSATTSDSSMEATKIVVATDNGNSKI